jgi:hypothetical protein
MNIFKLLLAPLLVGVAILIFEPLFGQEYPMTTHSIYLIVSLSALAWAYRNELTVVGLGLNKLVK